MSGPPLSSLELRRDEAAGCLLYRSMGSPLSEKEAHDIQGPEVKNKPYKRWSEWECDVILTKPSGTYNRRAPWSIPKMLVGEYPTTFDPPSKQFNSENDDGVYKLEQIARRALARKCSLKVENSRQMPYLMTLPYPHNGKTLFVFRDQIPPGVPVDPKESAWETVESRLMSFEKAYKMINPNQRPVLDKLKQILILEEQKLLKANMEAKSAPAPSRK